ncbi:DUF167 domain-containing protein [Candidatus Parcubacteria bacterium]|nr:DUF167 domain-containing protein [Candidatus Parcubacteria bacterium]
MLIKVKVFPNSKKKEIIKKSEDSFEIKVKAKPVKGLANRAVRDALASYFNISHSKIKLVKGFEQRNKIFEVNQ